MGLKMRQIETPAALAAISSYVSPRFPKVMIEESRIDKGKASGIILAEKKNISLEITSQPIPFPAKSSI